jgi:hypothetical protein
MTVATLDRLYDPRHVLPVLPEPPRPRQRPLRVALVSGSYNTVKDGVTLTLNRLVGYLGRHGAKSVTVHKSLLQNVMERRRTSFASATGLTSNTWIRHDRTVADQRRRR